MEISVKGVVWDIRRSVSYESEDFWLEHLNFLCVWFFGSAPELYTVEPDGFKKKIVDINFGFERMLRELTKDVKSEKVETFV